MMWFVREEFSFGVHSQRRLSDHPSFSLSLWRSAAGVFSFQLHPVSWEKGPSWCQRLPGRSKPTPRNNFKDAGPKCTCGDPQRCRFTAVWRNRFNEIFKLQSNC
ncbi:hypothetical protein TNCV_1398241 [Trichonephila clavipes]|nr:hypothetical protein TNCV_1398241 [Trichonephila clavipes]